MKTAYQLSLPFLLILVLLGCASSGQRNISPWNRNSESEFQSLMDQARIEGNLPAIGVLIKSQDQDVFFRVKGRRAIQHETSVTPADVWHLGSDTKAMTAYLIAQAVENKKIGYQTRLSDIFKNIPLHAKNADLTLADVLSHQSGLKDVQDVKHGQLWKELFTSKKSLAQQRLEMSAAALQEEPNIKPPTAQSLRTFSYANINYIVAGTMLELIYKQSWETLMQEHIFKPLQMTSCGFGVAGSAEETLPSEPWPHVIKGGKQLGVAPKERLDNPPFLGPAGTAHCSLGDWGKFISELILVWQGKSQNLKTDSRFFRSTGAGTYTMAGWGRNDDRYKTPVFNHNGSNTFNFASGNFAPEKSLTILIVTNTGTDQAEAAINKLRKLFSERFLPVQ